MTFPSSVEHLPLPRSKRHGRRLNKQYGDEPQHEIELQAADKEVELNTEVGVGGTILDFGRSGGVTLEKGKKGWGWIWASEDREDLRYVAEDKATCLFPATKIVEKQRTEVPTKEMVDSSTKYIETLCSPYERYGLREALISILDDESNKAGPSNTSKSRALPIPIPDRDPYIGPKLAIIHNSKARIAKTLLAFPVGEVGHHLNVSPFLPANSTKVDPRSQVRFIPTHKVVERFPTPILQIVSSPVVSSSRIDREATALLIRLQSTTHILNLIPDHTYIPPSSQPPILCQRTASLSYEDTEGRRHVDVAIDPTVWSRILVVDENGGVWLWWEEKENRNGRIEKAWNLRKIRSKITNEKHQFFRIAFGTRPGTAVVISSKEAVVIDINDADHPSTTLLTLRGRDRHFTSLEKTALERKSQFTVISTNHEVIWIDEGKPGIPVMSWKHDFGNSQELEVGVIPGLTSKDSCTILYSSTQQFIMTFPTTKSAPFRSLSHPYTLNLPIKEIGSIIPFSPASFRHSRSLICTTLDGAIYSIPITSEFGKTSEKDKENGIMALKANWDENVQNIKNRFESGDGIDQKDDTENKKKWKEMDFRWAWLEINRPPRPTGEERYFHPEEFEQYLREMDAPLEYLMTAGDLARDSIYPEPTELRSHLITPLPIPSQASRVTVDSLSGVNLSKHLPVIQTLSGDLPILKESRPPLGQRTTNSISPSSIYENLKESFPSVNNQDIAKLSIDLDLSRNILYSEAISLPIENEDRSINTQVTEPDELFARAAGQLTLNDTQPPKIKYHFLIPKQSDGFDSDPEDERLGKDGEEGIEEELQNITARGLLQDWKIGENPGLFEWKSWRKDDNDDLTNERDSHNYHSLPSQSQKERMIKPLPSSSSFLSPLKSSQPSFLSQSNYYNQYPTPPVITTNTGIQSYSQPNLKPSSSFPNLKNLPPDLGLSRSSPPPMNMNTNSSQPGLEEVNGDESETLHWASTQVERGPFGGREGGREKKKKKEKKRIGGF